jgi:hypothetical protein
VKRIFFRRSGVVRADRKALSTGDPPVLTPARPATGETGRAPSDDADRRAT